MGGVSTMHGVPHEIIETRRPVTMTAEQIKDAEENPLNRKREEFFKKVDEAKMWKERALDAEKSLVARLNEIETLKNGQLLPADKAAPMDVQKMKEKIIDLQNMLSPYKYEFTIGGSLVSVMVRPRAREVIPL